MKIKNIHEGVRVQMKESDGTIQAGRVGTCLETSSIPCVQWDATDTEPSIEHPVIYYEIRKYKG